MKSGGGFSGAAAPAAGIAANVFVVTVFLSVGLSPALRSAPDRAVARFLFVSCALLAAAFALAFSWFAAASFARRSRRETALRTLYGMRRSSAFLSLAGNFASASAGAGALGFIAAWVLNPFCSLVVGWLSRGRAPIEMPLDRRIALAAAALVVLIMATAAIAIALALKGSGPAALFGSDQRPRRKPEKARIRGLCGIALVGAGYIGALQPYAALTAPLALPVLAAVVAGTFLFLGGLPDLASGSRLRRLPEISAPLRLALARLAIDLRSRYRSFALIAVFAATALTAGGLLAALAANETVQVFRAAPNSLELTGRDRRTLDEVAARIGRSIQAAESASNPARPRATFLRVEALPVELRFTNNDRFFASEALSFSAWKALMEASGRSAAAERESAEIMGTGYFRTVWGAEFSGTAELRTAGGVGVKGRFKILNDGYVKSTESVLRQIILNDSLWEKLNLSVPENERVGSCVWNSPDPDSFRSLGPSFDASLREAKLMGLRPVLRTDAADEYRRNAGALLFITVLLTAAFLAVVVSALAFKLWEGMDEDRRGLAVLDSIGMRKKDADRSVAYRIALSFALPAVIGTAHASFAFRMAVTSSNFTVLPAAAVTTAASLAAFAISARVLSNLYLRAVSARR